MATNPNRPGESQGDEGQHSPLNERAQSLLRLLIERFIQEGRPVGSRTLVKDARLDLSPATVRNTMADLEEMGFLRSPHTSAGRVPTVKGYRFFVDSLLQVKPLTSREVERLRRELDPDLATGDLVQSVSSLLSGITRMAGVVMVPRRQQQALRHVEFLPLSGNRVLVILVINEQEVQNRIIHTRRTYSAAELTEAANFLNAQFIGRGLRQVREALVEDMRQTRVSMDRLMRTVVEMAEQVFVDPIPDQELVIDGEVNLMGFTELSDVDKLRQLFEAFNRKRDILHLFDQCLNAQGLQIFIGEESGFGPLDEVSVVSAPYSVEGQ
ncbi:MAG: heat-inducible transcriptional repressor HrcA, partial [Candidatus Competibacteraceae bacterium]|nr:heat-inducible transcriptional repressor HrcA [Candidatus Competibacteraceae bacterium]